MAFGRSGDIFNRFFTIIGDCDKEPFILQKLRGHLLVDLVVFHQKDARTQDRLESSWPFCLFPGSFDFTFYRQAKGIHDGV